MTGLLANGWLAELPFFQIGNDDYLMIDTDHDDMSLESSVETFNRIQKKFIPFERDEQSNELYRP